MYARLSDADWAGYVEASRGATVDASVATRFSHDLSGTMQLLRERASDSETAAAGPRVAVLLCCCRAYSRARGANKFNGHHRPLHLSVELRRHLRPVSSGKPSPFSYHRRLCMQPTASTSPVDAELASAPTRCHH